MGSGTRKRIAAGVLGAGLGIAATLERWVPPAWLGAAVALLLAALGVTLLALASGALPDGFAGGLPGGSDAAAAEGPDPALGLADGGDGPLRPRVR